MNTQPASKSRILVVEDEKHIAEGIRLNLSLLGYDVRIATDGVSALQQWKAWRPDLIVLDIMLPGIDGFSVLQSIRLEDEKLPILILSAKAGPDDRVRGLAHGVDDYLAKPFNLEEFQLRVERLIKRAAWGRGENGNGSENLTVTETVYRFGSKHGRVRHRKGALQGRGCALDGTGAQTAEAFHQTPGKTPVAHQDPGDRMGLHR